jgi:toxin-antitoxin system PIN domain toxin
VTATLLDGNVLIALLVEDHVHHSAADRWWQDNDGFEVATSPITQGTLLRFLVRNGVTASAALQMLGEFAARAKHVFWPDEIAYDSAVLRGVIGHRQVTDFYLAALARHRKGRLATFDAGLQSSHVDIVDLIATP